MENSPSAILLRVRDSDIMRTSNIYNVVQKSFSWTILRRGCFFGLEPIRQETIYNKMVFGMDYGIQLESSINALALACTHLYQRFALAQATLYEDFKFP